MRLRKSVNVVERMDEKNELKLMLGFEQELMEEIGVTGTGTGNGRTSS